MDATLTVDQVKSQFPKAWEVHLRQVAECNDDNPVKPENYTWADPEHACWEWHLTPTGKLAYWFNDGYHASTLMVWDGEYFCDAEDEDYTE